MAVVAKKKKLNNKKVDYFLEFEDVIPIEELSPLYFASRDNLWGVISSTKREIIVDIEYELDNIQYLTDDVFKLTMNNRIHIFCTRTKKPLLRNLCFFQKENKKLYTAYRNRRGGIFCMEKRKLVVPIKFGNVKPCSIAASSLHSPTLKVSQRE